MTIYVCIGEGYPASNEGRESRAVASILCLFSRQRMLAWVEVKHGGGGKILQFHSKDGTKIKIKCISSTYSWWVAVAHGRRTIPVSIVILLLWAFLCFFSMSRWLTRLKRWRPLVPTSWTRFALAFGVLSVFNVWLHLPLFYVSRHFDKPWIPSWQTNH